MTTRRFTVIHDDLGDDGSLQGAVVAIGNFDGMHRGHRAVINAAIARAKSGGGPSAVLTFEPHPRRYFRPNDRHFRLTDAKTKVRLLSHTDLDGVIVLTFDRQLAELTAEEFIHRVLVERFNVGGVVIGFDFHFGKDRGGTPDYLVKEGARRSFGVDVVHALEDEGKPVSASSIRAELEAGRVVEAAELLGYPWFVTGDVIRGEKRGRDLGYPTANLRLDPDCGLKHGIYAVRVRIGDKIHDGVASFGRRPTFDNGAPLLETYLFGFDGDLYGQEIDVAFVGWIRAEKRFEGIDALVRQMDDDSRRAREILERAPAAIPPA